MEYGDCSMVSGSPLSDHLMSKSDGFPSLYQLVVSGCERTIYYYRSAAAVDYAQYWRTLFLMDTSSCYTFNSTLEKREQLLVNINRNGKWCGRDGLDVTKFDEVN
ncbi:hypothetical protein GQX74_010349 [Glossina fuscipes]|nr:hypothetical protein GQX74_010349 [Glossina fuscipes]